MDQTLLIDLLHLLDAPQHTYCQLDRYWQGKQALSYLSPESQAVLGKRFARLSVNLVRVAVNAVAERLRLSNLSGVWDEFIANDLDQLSGIAHREALLLGQSFVVVWADSTGAPNVSIETARQTAVMMDPGTREAVAAVKRWRTPTTTECTVFLAEEVIRLRADTPGAATAGFHAVDRLDNPLGVVPVVRLANTDLIGEPVSDVADLLDLVDALVKLNVDLLTGSEWGAKPRRFATGIELVERAKLDDDGNPVMDGDERVMEVVNPFPDESAKMMVSENENSRFGSLPAADLRGYTNAVDIILSEIAAVSCLPPHYLGILHDNPSSADALRASEASLTAKAAAKQAQFGRGWEQVGRLIAAVRDGVDPSEVDCRVSWCDPSTRSIAQESDAVVKLVAAGILPVSVALQKLGYSADEIDAIRAARALDAITNTTLLPNFTQTGPQPQE